MLASLVVSISAVVCLLVAEWADSKLARGAAKMSAASAFVAMALACGALDSTFGQIMLAGFVLCWIGDACLLSSGHSTGFLLGIAAFLLGHVAYAVAFHRLGLDPAGLAIGAVVMAGFGFAMIRWLRPHLPYDFRIPVWSYLGVISLMVVASIGAAGAGASPLFVVGAVAFAISDVFVARERFVQTGFVNAGVGLPLYFGSQMLLAYSITLAV